MSAAPFGPIEADQVQIRSMMDAVHDFVLFTQTYQAVDVSVNAEDREKLRLICDSEMLRVADCAVTLQHNGVFKRCLEALEAQS